MYQVRRIRESFRGGSKCRVPRCPYRSLPTASVYCRDHTDAVLAGGPADRDQECARRVGARRWFLRAEVKLESERRHVRVLEDILAMTPQEKAINRRVWDYPTPTVDPPMTARVDELLALAVENA